MKPGDLVEFSQGSWWGSPDARVRTLGIYMGSENGQCKILYEGKELWVHQLFVVSLDPKHKY